MRTLPLLAAGLLLSGILGIAGCAGPDRPVWASFDPDDWANRGETDEPVTLDVAGPVAIDVEAFNGDVVIKADEGLQQAKVTIVREAIHGYKREKEGKASLTEITAAVDKMPAEIGEVIQVRTSTANAEPHLQRTHVYIEAPAIENIRVKTANGRVYATNIEGAVDIATTDGEVRVMTNRAMTKPVLIINKDGDINYRVRGESSGAFDCETIDGRATHKVQYGKLIIHSGTDDDSFHGVLNNGTNPVVLRTVDGDIRVAIVHNPEHVGQRIME